MQDTDFVVLQVKASICPQAETWAKPDHSKITITGDTPHVEPGELYLGSLHDAVTEARTHVLKTMGTMTAINEDKSLSSVGREEKRQAAAAKAVADFEKSQKLSKARAAVAAQVMTWDHELGLRQKSPENIADAMIGAEIRAHLAAMKPADRLGFIDSHASEVAAAVLGTAPPFLSGLTSADLDIARQRIAKRTNPKVAAARDDALRALDDVERGWRSATRRLFELGGLKRPDNGGQ